MSAPMRTLSIVQLQDIGNELSVRLDARKARLDAFADTHEEIASLIASEIVCECYIHMLALASVMRFLIAELIAWLANKPDALDPQRNGNVIAEEFARRSLENCLAVLGPDDTDKLLEVGSTILQKVVEISSVEIPIKAIKMVNDLMEIRKLLKLPTSDVTTASKVLLEFELFMRSSLLAARCATSLVHLVTGDSPANADSSRELVIFYLREARSTIAKEKKEWLCFPKDGLWPTWPEV